VKHFAIDTPEYDVSYRHTMNERVGTVIGFRATSALKQALRLAARSEDRSAASLVRRILENDLKARGFYTDEPKRGARRRAGP